MLLLPEHASSHGAPKKPQVVPNIDIEAIAHMCMDFQNEFLEKYAPIDALLDEMEEHAPELHKLIYKCVKPLEDFIKNNFDRFTIIAGKAARHGWDRGGADGVYQGALMVLDHVQDLTKNEITRTFTEEEWQEFIRAEREFIIRNYAKQSGGIKVMWDFGKNY